MCGCPDGEPCFPGVPDALAAADPCRHGLRAGEPRMLDAAYDVSVTPWRRSA